MCLCCFLRILNCSLTESSGSNRFLIYNRLSFVFSSFPLTQCIGMNRYKNRLNDNGKPDFRFAINPIHNRKLEINVTLQFLILSHKTRGVPYKFATIPLLQGSCFPCVSMCGIPSNVPIDSMTVK